MKLLIEFKKNEHTGRADIVLPDGIWRGTSMPWDEAEEYAAAMAPQDGLREALEREERNHSNTIDQRDHAQDMADKLAEGIAQYFDVEIGEHSNANCPWENALRQISDAPKALAPSPAAQHEAMAPAGVQSARDAAKTIADLVLKVSGQLIIGDEMRDGMIAIIAQHRETYAQARTKPLVEALDDMEGGLELMRMAVMGHADRTELTKRINLLIKDCQRWRALAQEKGLRDG